MKTEYDCIIVGAGPAGMFAADELAGRLDTLIIDQGRDIDRRECKMKRRGICTHCDPCDIMCGVGGAGTYSDGTLNLRPDVGGDLAEQTGDPEYAWELVDHVDRVFVRYGAPDQMYIPKGEEVELLKRRAAAVGARFIEITQRHMGSDNAPKVIGNFEKDLKDRGVEFILSTKVDDLIIEDNASVGVVLGDKSEILSRFTVIAP
ncbi:MAG: FAD-dependent oxidoreductase, partial [Candidatus Methanoperedens sp.]|nr:FAD-dependent oxidoreductase [Candidatus Methanoperedens sp.]